MMVKKVHILSAVAMGLVLATVAPVFVPTEVSAAVVATKSGVRAAKQYAESVLVRVEAMERADLAGSVAYLEGLVVQAESELSNASAMSADGMKELTEALEEGALALGLMAGMGASESKEGTAQPKVQAEAVTATEKKTEAPVAKQTKNAAKAVPVKAVATKGQEPVVVLADTKAEQAIDGSDSDKIAEAREGREVAQADLSDAEVEEVVDSAKDMLRATGIVMSVIVVLAAVGAVFAVKRIKRNL